MTEIWGKAKNFRMVPAVIFIYDCSRLLFLVMVSGFFLRPEPDLKTINFPLMMFVSPNALFPLISFFLLIRFDVSKAYIPLYITGKALCLVCLTVWLFFGLRHILSIREIPWPVFLCAADLVTIMGIALQGIESPHGNSVVEAPRTNVQAAEGGE